MRFREVATKDVELVSIRDQLRPNFGDFIGGLIFFRKSQLGVVLQFLPVCSEFFGKFNETDGNFLAGIVFKKIVKNHGGSEES
jgi:hypothetical protein